MLPLHQPFGVSLAGYQMILIAGCVLGAAVAVARGHQRRLALPTVLDAALAAAFGALLLGRGVYVGLNSTYFQGHLGEAARFWRGGLSGPGALAGGIVGALAFCRWRRIDPRPVLDVLAPGAAVVALAAWAACLVAGCAWGIEVWPDQDLLWYLRAELPDLYGVRAPRLPVQILGIVWSAGLLAVTWLTGRGGRPFPLWLTLHAIGDFGLRFLRGDVTPVVTGLGLGQGTDLALALLGLMLWVLPIWRRDGDRVQYME